MRDDGHVYEPRDECVGRRHSPRCWRALTRRAEEYMSYAVEVEATAAGTIAVLSFEAVARQLVKQVRASAQETRAGVWGEGGVTRGPAGAGYHDRQPAARVGGGEDVRPREHAPVRARADAAVPEREGRGELRGRVSSRAVARARARLLTHRGAGTGRSSQRRASRRRG